MKNIKWNVKLSNPLNGESLEHKLYDSIEHIHKEHIVRDALKAGTFLGKYPSRVEGAVKQLRMV